MYLYPEDNNVSQENFLLCSDYVHQEAQRDSCYFFQTLVFIVVFRLVTPKSPTWGSFLLY